MAARKNTIKQSLIDNHLFGNRTILVEPIELGVKEHFEGIHRHDFYEILWFIEVNPGEGHWIDFEYYPLENGQLYFIAPGQVHQMDLTCQKGYVVACSPILMREIIGTSDLNLLYSGLKGTIPDVTTTATCKLLINLLAEELKNRRRQQIVTSYFKTLFLLLVDQRPELRNTQKKDQNRLDRLTELIEINFVRQKGTSFYASEMFLSSSRLNTLCKVAWGKTVKQLINDRLLLEAKRDVMHSMLPIKQIAFNLGFDDPAYFSRFFKLHVGETTDEFKKRQVR